MLYEMFSNFVPSKIKEIFDLELKYAGFETNSLRFVGFLFIYSLLFSIAFSYILATLFNFEILILIPILFFTFCLLVYFIIGNVADRRAAYVEKILPDALHLVASNIKSGLTT